MSWAKIYEQAATCVPGPPPVAYVWTCTERRVALPPVPGCILSYGVMLDKVLTWMESAPDLMQSGLPRKAIRPDEVIHRSITPVRPDP